MSTLPISSAPQGDSQEDYTEFQFRPLTTGQVLDRSFALYRSHFGLFAGFAVFPAAVSLLFGLLQTGYLLMTHQPLPGSGGRMATNTAYMTIAFSMVAGLARICVYGISIAATTWCIASIYQGKSATMKGGFEFAFKKWFRFIVLVLAQAWSAMWLPFALATAAIAAVFFIPGMRQSRSGAIGIGVFLLAGASVVWGVVRFLRVSLAIPACVVEELGILASIRRSKALLVSRKGRIFLLFLFIFALEMVLFAALVPISVLTIHSGPTGKLIVQMSTLGLTFLYGVLVSPIAAVALCLFYFDERVRREAFDIEFLMRKSAAPLEPPAPELPAES
jgi:hypothetical protein